MATTRDTRASAAPALGTDDDAATGGADPWEGFTPEERAKGYRILTPEEGREQFDRAARRWLGIGGDEFIRRWDAGEYDATADKDGHRHIMQLALLNGLARQDS